MSLTSTLAIRAAPPATRVDHALLRRAFLALGLALVVIAPFSPDPVALAAGAMVPWLVLRIIGSPNLPAAVIYYLLWQWLQTYARALLGLVDGEQMSRSIFGPWVADAYWYMLASIVVLAIAFRMVLTTMRTPSPQSQTAHLEWRTVDLFQAYLIALFVSSAARFVADFIPALDQPLEGVTRFKVIALFVLFANVLSSGKGMKLLLAAVGVELVVGFSSLQSEFRSVFVILFVAAIAARIRWKGTTAAVVGVGAVVLVVLSLFWTAVKGEYRQFATNSDDSQVIRMGLDARFGYLGNRLTTSADIDWTTASYALLTRLAYVDIFGSVIGVKRVSPEQGTFRQWSDALSHVFQPRFLFPDKASLSDTEVFIRLARGDATEQTRLGTSISVGYLAENFVDFDFPGMLGSVFAIGLIIAGICRYFGSLSLPWMVREGVIMALLLAVGGNGVEGSLPKVFGSAFMFFVVYALLAKFALPIGLRWLDNRAAMARRRETMRQQVRTTRQPSLK